MGKKEIYATIDVATEEDYNKLKERIEKQKAKKPLGVDLHKKESGNIHLWVCPICEIFLLGRRMADEKKSFHPNYCPGCQQEYIVATTAAEPQTMPSGAKDLKRCRP